MQRYKAIRWVYVLGIPETKAEENNKTQELFQGCEILVNNS